MRSETSPLIDRVQSDVVETRTPGEDAAIHIASRRSQVRGHQWAVDVSIESWGRSGFRQRVNAGPALFIWFSG